HELPKKEDIDDFLADIPEEQLNMFMNEEMTIGVMTVGIKHLETEHLQDFITDLDQFLQRESLGEMTTDRKSTRVNSSHVSISYAVFCLKKNSIIELV